MLLGLVAVVVLLIISALFYEVVSERIDSRRLPPPGRLVDIGTGRLHLHEQGIGEPTVLLEAGIAGSSIGWALVQPEISKFTRVCSYDRAGLGWSGPSSAPRTVDQMNAELRQLVDRAEIPPPYILVGHSFGGLLVRAFAQTNPTVVAGFVLVDPVSVESWASCSAAEKRRLDLGVSLSRRGALLARFGIVRGALSLLSAGGRRLPKLVARASAGVATGTLQRLIGEVLKLPPEVQPMIRAHWSAPKCFTAMASYLTVLPDSARLASNFQIAENIPCIILSASDSKPGEFAERDRWAAQSHYGKHVQVDGTGHWIQLERPDVVVAAVRELVELTRKV